MKTWMKVVLGIAAGFAVLLGFVFWLTGDVTKAGDDFFAAAKNDDMDAAYALLSEDFQAGTSKEELKSYLAANALNDVKDTSWSSRSISGDIGTLEGTVTTAVGGKLPLVLQLINSETGWKILSIRKRPAGFGSGGTDTPIPSKKEQVKLVTETMGIFADSLSDRSLQKLYDHSASVWQKQITAEEMGEMFGDLYGEVQGYRLLSITVPVLDRTATLNQENGVLAIDGYYLIGSDRLEFTQKYVFEGTGWKLVGLFLKPGKASEPRGS